MCSNGVAGEVGGDMKTFVIDCSQSTGDIVSIQIKNKNVQSEIIVEDATSFQSALKGHFIYRSRQGYWYKGDVKSPKGISKIKASIVPKNVTYAAISNKGNRVVWVTLSGNKSSIVLSDLNKNEVHILLSKDGYICVPSWSPDDSHIAYYYGPPDVISKDNYSLVIIEVEAIELKEREIAPPSLWTRLTPGRTNPPIWSPDGSMLIFEARYSNEKPISSTYLAGSDGKGLRPFMRGTWNHDSKRVFTVSTIGDSKVGYKHTLAIANVLSKERVMENLQIDLPEDSINVQWAYDGKHVAFSTSNNRIYLLETSTNRRRKVFDCDSSCMIYWVTD